MKKILIFTCATIIVFVSGCFTGYYLGLPDNNKTNNPIKTVQISGETIKHTPIKVNKNTIEFNTIADGKGEINTEIEKTVVPEAKYWIEKVNIIQLEVDNYFNIRPTYLRRFGVFAIGAGIQIPTDKDSEFAIFAIGSYMF